MIRSIKTVSIASIVLLGVMSLFAYSTSAQSPAPDDPSSYAFVWYEEQNDTFVTRLTIEHEGSYEAPFDEPLQFEIAGPSPLFGFTGELYFVPDSGPRELVENFDFSNDSMTWTQAGTYELDIYEVELRVNQHAPAMKSFAQWLIPTAYAYPDYLYLATMRFEIQEEGSAAAPPPTCALAANPESIVAGETVTLSWDSEYASVATINPDVGIVATEGSQAISPTETTTYELTVVGEGGQTVCSISVFVSPGPIELPLRYQAAENAIELVDTPDGYTLGAKGWDYDEGGFISAANVLSGYSYYDLALGRTTPGKGVDCSGLVMWSYNYANDPDAYLTKNFVKYEGADGQFQSTNGQSFEVDRDELEPGDTLYFNYRGDSRIDHTAMFVGDQGGWDVVNAESRDTGIVSRSIETYARDSDPAFRGFRRIANAKLAMKVEAGSPVDLAVTDPDGNTLAAGMVEITEEEYLREIPGELYYTEGMKGHDGNPVDIVYGPELKEGQYVIEVFPIEGAEPTDTYSLTFTGGDETIVLAEDEPISSIPPLGFIVEVTADEEINVVERTIEDLLAALDETADNADISPRFLKLRVKGNIAAAEHFYENDRSVLLTLTLKNLKGLIERRTGRGVLEEDAQQMTAIIDELLIRLK